MVMQKSKVHIVDMLASQEETGKFESGNFWIATRQN